MCLGSRASTNFARPRLCDRCHKVSRYQNRWPCNDHDIFSAQRQRLEPVVLVSQVYIYESGKFRFAKVILGWFTDYLGLFSPISAFPGLRCKGLSGIRRQVWGRNGDTDPIDFFWSGMSATEWRMLMGFVLGAWYHISEGHVLYQFRSTFEQRRGSFENKTLILSYIF